MKISVTDLVEEERMLNGVKCFANVNGHSCSTKGRFLLVEAVGDAGDGRKESRGGRVKGAETMLGWGWG